MTDKHTKKPFTMEFVFKASKNILFKLLSTPTGLAQWFADGVDVEDDTYIFEWSGTQERATCLEKSEPELVKFQWEESEADEYFQFKLDKAEITGDTVLFVTDFAADYELEDQQMLWNNQVSELMKRVGG